MNLMHEVLFFRKCFDLIQSLVHPFGQKLHNSEYQCVYSVITTSLSMENFFVLYVLY